MQQRFFNPVCTVKASFIQQLLHDVHVHESGQLQDELCKKNFFFLYMKKISKQAALLLHVVVIFWQWL